MPGTPRRLPLAVQSFVDVALEWRHAGEPLRRVLQRHQKTLRGVTSTRRRQIEDWLFVYARERDAIEARVESVIERLPVQARRPDLRDRLLVVYALLGDDEVRAQVREFLESHLCSALEAELGDASISTAQPGFPPSVLEELKERLGETEADAAVEALCQRAPLALRVRPPHPVDEVLALLQAEGVQARTHALVPQAVLVDSPLRLEAHPRLTPALVAVQDSSSQVAVRALGVQPGLHVVDTCAGGGGKALAIAEQLTRTGRLLLMDLDARRLRQAQHRLEEGGVPCSLSTQRHDWREPCPPELRAQFDRVLVDAPCSGLGTVRRHPDLLWRYGSEDIERLAQDQAVLVRQAARLLRPGGLLLYTTCSLRRRENEQVVEQVLRTSPLVPVPLTHTLGALAGALGAEAHMLTLWPHRHDGDGFFLALFSVRQTALASP
ncbi:MAG: RsmB/NOP family class I SAM-dependent RNA methyltransferase [Pseudomonadota bacterium]